MPDKRCKDRSGPPGDPLVVSADLAPQDMRVGQAQPAAAEARILVAVGVGGALGALARYELGLTISTSGYGFPLATWLINVSGSLLLGFLITVLVERRRPSAYARPFLATGFTGGYTTWSTFMVDADLLLQHHHPLTAVAYVLATLAGGLAALSVGVWGTRRLPRSRLTPLPSPRLGGVPTPAPPR